MTHVRRILNRTCELRGLSLWAVAVAQELGCPEAKRHEVDLCLTEAVSNVVRHGYADDGPHEIEVTLGRETDALVMSIEDDARPFDPTSAEVRPHPTSLEEAGLTGRGIPLIRSSADSASYERREGRNRLTLRFRLED